MKLIVLIISLSFAASAQSLDCATFEDCTIRKDILRTSLEVLTATCKSQIAAAKCSTVPEQEYVRSCNPKDICLDSQTGLKWARGALSCGKGVVDFGVDTVQGMWSFATGAAEVMFETMFCPQQHCLENAEQKTARDQLAAIEIASKYAGEQDYCQKNNCSAPQVSCLDLSQSCKGAFHDLKNCSANMKSTFAALSSHSRSGKPVKNPTSGEADEWIAPSVDERGAAALFMKKSSECFSIRAEWSRQQPDLLQKTKAVVNNIFELKQRELICYKPGYQGQVICKTLVEIGALAAGGAGLLRTVFRLLKEGKSVGEIAAIMANGGERAAATSSYRVGPAKNPPEDIWMTEPETKAVSAKDVWEDVWEVEPEAPKPVNLYSQSLKENQFTKHDLTNLDVKKLSDDQVLEFFNRKGRPTSAIEKEQLRAQLQSRVDAVKGAEDYARMHGWDPSKVKGDVLASEDFQPLPTDSPFAHKDRVIHPDSLVDNAAFGYRKGWKTVQVHGMPGSFVINDSGATVNDLATAIRAAGYRGEPISLISCNAGTCSMGPSSAQELANILGGPVVAADSVIQMEYGASHLIRISSAQELVSLNGSWRTFYPMKK